MFRLDVHLGHVKMVSWSRFSLDLFFVEILIFYKKAIQRVTWILTVTSFEYYFSRIKWGEYVIRYFVETLNIQRQLAFVITILQFPSPQGAPYIITVSSNTTRLVYKELWCHLKIRTPKRLSKMKLFGLALPLSYAQSSDVRSIDTARANYENARVCGLMTGRGGAMNDSLSLE